MECNKDEALKAKGIAEKKLLSGDIIGAKRFALKAQRMFPKLDGLSQFLVIIDVYAAHNNKINGQLDYYGILGVDRCADEQVLKNRYKRMALSLHPVKNRSVGADGAFKIVYQAWSVLSDKYTRNAYNSKLNTRAAVKSQNNVPTRPRSNKPQSVPTQSQTKGSGSNPQSTTARGNAHKRKSGRSSERKFWSWRRVEKYMNVSLTLLLFLSLELSLFVYPPILERRQ